METKIRNRFEKVENRVDKLEKFIEGGLSKKGKLVECHRCNHSWLCKSNAIHISCPSCGTKTRNTGVKGLVKCFKCEKYLGKNKAKFGYNHHFHKSCFKEFDKKAKGEVDKMMNDVEKKGKI